MLNIAFGQSKYYVDSLSENTQRNAGLCPAAEGESTRRGRLLSFRSIADYSAIPANCTKESTSQSVSAFVLESQNKIRAINEKLQRLLDGYLEQDIEREIYREQKTKLLMEKKSLDEKMARRASVSALSRASRG